MKKIIYILLLTVLVLGCEKEDHPVYKLLAEPAFTAPTGGSSFVLTEETETDTIFTLEWSTADYGFQAAVTYTLFLDLAGNEFEDAKELGESVSNKLYVTGSTLNNLMLTLGASPEVPTDIEIMIRAMISSDLDTMYSNTLAMTITPFEKIIIYPHLYVPGSYQDEWNASWTEWDAANEYTCVFSVNDNNVYEGYLYFPDATTEHKFLMTAEWLEDQTIGDPVSGGQSGTLQIGSWGGNNIVVSTGPGYFLVKANLVALTYSHTLTDWGLIGSATPGDWSTDTPMTYDPASDTWSVSVDLIAGEMKFRANESWDINLGDTNADGSLEYSGTNLTVETAGSYTVVLDLSEAIYTYSVTPN